jgi:putative ABC transport system permease protein
MRRLAGAFVAALIGVAAVSLSTLLLASGRAIVPERLAAAAIVVQSPILETPGDPFPESKPWSSGTVAGLADRLAAIPGVLVAVPDRQFYIQQPAREGLAGTHAPREARAGAAAEYNVVRGHGWSSAQLGQHRLVEGTAPDAPGEVALDGHPPGSSVVLLTAAGPAPYRVTGRVDGPAIYLSDKEAATLAPGVRVIGLVLRGGADVDAVAAQARTIVGADGRVLTGDDRAALEPRDDARTRWIGMQALTATAALAGFVAIFVVASTFAFVVTQRRRELGLLRTIGATPRQVKRMLYGEALAVGGTASLAGTALGALLAPWVGRALIDAGLEPATFEVRYPLWPLAVSIAVGPVIGLLGVWSAARRAARVSPLEALREADVEARPMGRTRWLLGALCVAIGLAFAAGTATADSASDGGTYALYGAMALVLGATLLAPAFVPVLAWLLAFAARGATGMLVREGARAAARRTASTAAPVLLTVTFAILIAGLVQTSAAAYAAGRATKVDAGYVVAPDGSPGLTDAVASSIPGASLLPTNVYRPDGERLRAFGVDRMAFRSVEGLSEPDTAIVAESLGLRTGDTYPITLADGETLAVRVVAVVPDDAIPARLLLPRATVRAHDRSALTSAILVADRPQLPAASGARVVDVEAYAAEYDSEEDRLVWVFTLLLISVSAGYGAIAVANTLLLATMHRTRDFAVLRMAGATKAQVTRAVAAEAALVVAIGTLLGGVVAVIALLSIRAGLSEQVGAPVDLVVPWPTIGAVIALCLVLALVASAVPARLLVRESAKAPQWTPRRRRR